MQAVREQTTKTLKGKVYHWKPVDMDAYTGLVYMSAHLLSNYSLLYYTMNEVWLIVVLQPWVKMGPSLFDYLKILIMQ